MNFSFRNLIQTECIWIASMFNVTHAIHSFHLRIKTFVCVWINILRLHKHSHKRHTYDYHCNVTNRNWTTRAFPQIMRNEFIWLPRAMINIRIQMWTVIGGKVFVSLARCQLCSMRSSNETTEWHLSIFTFECESRVPRKCGISSPLALANAAICCARQPTQCVEM